MPQSNVSSALDNHTDLGQLEVISMTSIRGDDDSSQIVFFEKQQKASRRKLDKIGQDLVQKNDRLELFKKPRHDPISSSKKDAQYPHLKYFYECKNSASMVLPILEKVVGKTICL